MHFINLDLFDVRESYKGSSLRRRAAQNLKGFCIRLESTDGNKISYPQIRVRVKIKSTKNQGVHEN